MLLSRQPVSRRYLFALCFAFCALPGCGGSGNSTVTASTASRFLTQTFQGQNFALATYALDGPIDQTKPFAVSVDSIPLVQGKEYFIDATFPNIVHINNPVPTSATVTIQYYTPPTVTDRFTIKSGSQSTFTLSRPIDPAHLNAVSLTLSQPGSGPQKDLTSQDYTITVGPPTVIHLASAIMMPRTLTVTYVPQMP